MKILWKVFDLKDACGLLDPQPVILYGGRDFPESQCCLEMLSLKGLLAGGGFTGSRESQLLLDGLSPT